LEGIALVNESFSFVYLFVLLVSILGLVGIDRKQNLALFRSPLPTVISVGIAVIVFLIWDIIGISLGIFFRGSTPFLSGLLLGPELPLEELFFLILLSYNTLLAYQFFSLKGKR
jgi:lycopene cyclase domain-containing protein